MVKCESLLGIIWLHGASRRVRSIAAAALALLVTTAGSLVAADWRDHVQSRQAWAQVNIAPAELRLPVVAVTRRDLDPRYLSAVDNEALRRIFQAHRFAPHAPMLGNTERVSASAASTSRMV